MNPRAKRVILLVACLLGCGWLLLTLVPKPDKRGADAEDGGGKSSELTAISRGGKGSPRASAGSALETGEVSVRALLAGKAMLHVSPEDVDAALEKDGRVASGLIAAQALLGDHSYLREAADQFPDDPQVQYWILTQRVLPEERGAWLEKFKSSDPDNALANYLAAEEAFRKQEPERGLEELKAAMGKGYRDYSDELQKMVGGLYRATGKFDEGSVRDGSARVISMPHVEQVQALAQRLRTYYDDAVEDGNEKAAGEIVTAGMAMLETVAGNSRADGIRARTTMLLMQEQLAEKSARSPEVKSGLKMERERLGELGVRVAEIFAGDGELDSLTLNSYAEKLHADGEVAAGEWLVEQVGGVD